MTSFQGHSRFQQGLQRMQLKERLGEGLLTTTTSFCGPVEASSGLPCPNFCVPSSTVRLSRSFQGRFCSGTAKDPGSSELIAPLSGSLCPVRLQSSMLQAHAVSSGEFPAGLDHGFQGPFQPSPPDPRCHSCSCWSFEFPSPIRQPWRPKGNLFSFSLPRLCPLAY